jgi:hypothetical protein
MAGISMRTVMVLLELLERENMSIKRLRDSVFGKRTEKRKQMSAAMRKERRKRGIGGLSMSLSGSGSMLKVTVKTE